MTESILMKSTPAIIAKLPADYKAARAAMAKLLRIDFVKEVRAKAIAMEVYAFQAQDAELMAPAATARKVAERRIGELIDEQRKAGTLAKGGDARRVARGKQYPEQKPSLESQGVDKNLAKRARAAAAMSEAKFEAEVKKAIKLAIASIMHHTEVIKAARAERHHVKKVRRQKREQELADKLQALPTKTYAVILADPEWQWEAWSEKGLTNSSAQNHYPTSVVDAIKARNVAAIAADDCVLFLWATAPMLPQAIEVMVAWGFTYKTQCVWAKDKAGTGYWFRNMHELLLVGTRGKPPAPLEGTQWESLVAAPRGKHSEKPQAFYELIEAYFPLLQKVELNARKARAGWDCWGNEAPPVEAAA